MIIVKPDNQGFRQAVDALRRDEIVAYPTETVYGLAVNPFSLNALKRLWSVKGRDAENPILVIVCDEAQLYTVASTISSAARRCIEVYWPGPLTLLLPKHKDIPVELTAGRPKVAVRQPAHAIALRLCREAGIPLTSTSANISGKQPATALAEITLAGIAVGIDGGLLPSSQPSTIFDPDENVLIRKGAITEEKIAVALAR